MDDIEYRIENDQYTLFDRFIYGGLGYGTFCVPSNIFRIFATVIFPPFAIIIEWITNEFPYINPKKILETFDKFFYSIILTSLFYIPGLIYSLSHISKVKSDFIAKNYS